MPAIKRTKGKNKMESYSLQEYKIWIMQEDEGKPYEVQDETGNSFGFFSTYREASEFCKTECEEQEFFGKTVTWGTTI